MTVSKVEPTFKGLQTSDILMHVCIMKFV